MLPTFSITAFNILVIIILNSSSDSFQHMSCVSLVLKIALSLGKVFILASLYASYTYICFVLFFPESQIPCVGQKISLEEFEACGVLRVTIATTNLIS